MDVLKDFLADVDAFIDRTGMPPSRLGKLSCRDGSLVADLKDGRREPRLSTIEKVRRFMSEYETGGARRRLSRRSPGAHG
jgi:hypothetical protein